MCEEGSCQFKRGREAERKWQTWPEERKGAFEKDNPWEAARWTHCPVSALLLLPACVLCHGYQTGLPMQPVNAFFSSRSELRTNVSQSVSCTINVNCPGMHKHMEGCEPGNTEPPWLSVRGWKKAASLSFLVTWKVLLALSAEALSHMSIFLTKVWNVEKVSHKIKEHSLLVWNAFKCSYIYWIHKAFKYNNTSHP